MFPFNSIYRDQIAVWDLFAKSQIYSGSNALFNLLMCTIILSDRYSTVTQLQLTSKSRVYNLTRKFAIASVKTSQAFKSVFAIGIKALVLN